ncbi:MFS transporter [Chlorella sorokiniana]|jgi:hypothetical protein|uniref:MFS transporter n=1 Tax=Chlorella sorokiniana TaxID=3076 RepID=A0A2P6U0Z4_CHLSO|nr:MFS transporter [Chlorella sorokiniana]|eukprot:PRW59986.1 MFS transporter [Chlorella sorokiniana]
MSSRSAKVLVCALLVLLLAASHAQASCTHRRAAARSLARAALPRVTSAWGSGSCRVDTVNGQPDVEVESCSNKGHGIIRLRIEADYYCQRPHGRWHDVYYYITAEVDTRNHNRVTRWIRVARGHDDK